MKKLIASQYLAELCLHQALSDQPQDDLFSLLNEHLARLERSPASQVLAHLTHAVFQLLVLAGVAPQVHLCCVTRASLLPDLTDRNWRIGFSIPVGGTVKLAALERLLARNSSPRRQRLDAALPEGEPQGNEPYTSLAVAAVDNIVKLHKPPQAIAGLHRRMSAPELMILQHLAEADLPEPQALLAQMQSEGASQGTLDQLWQSVEQALRSYAQYYFDRPIRSATLIDACFATADHA